MEYEVLAKKEFANVEKIWLIIGKEQDRDMLYAYLESTLPLSEIPNFINVSKNIEKWLKWKKAGNGIGLYINELSYLPTNGYNLNTILGFGMYKGLQVGLVYAFDPSYIDWLITEIDDFYLDDLELLQLFGTYNTFQVYNAGRDASFIHPFMYEFNSIQQLARELKVLNPENMLPQETIELNRRKRLSNKS